MASIEQNIQWWEGSEWKNGGDEWSSAYGTPGMQWHATIRPRICSFLPCKKILEIAPGFGRWTQFLKNECDDLMAVDMATKCIEACNRRFESESHLSFHVNDGRSLDMVPDRSVDFAFSFDSLVHVEADVIGTYLEQLARKLAKDGVLFIHHSNMGAFASYFAKLEMLPRGRGLLARLGIVEPGHHKRAFSMTADRFRTLANTAGLTVIRQELINWGTRRPIDCLSLATLPGSKWDGTYRQWVNTGFGREAANVYKLSRHYDGLGEESN